MPRVKISTQAWGYVINRTTNRPATGQLCVINTTVYTDAVGASTVSPASFVSDGEGLLPGWVETGVYQFTEPDGNAYQVDVATGDLATQAELDAAIIGPADPLGLVAITPSTSTRNLVAPSPVTACPLKLRNDASDTSPTLSLEGATTKAGQGGGPGYKKPAVNYRMDDTLIWQHGLDVGEGTYGPGRDDFFILHREKTDTAKSMDVFYITDEVDPRVGIGQANNALGMLHVVNRKNNRPVCILDFNEAAATDGWLLRLDRQGATKGGFWDDSAGLGLKLGIGTSVEPAFSLDVKGTAQLRQMRPENFYTALQSTTGGAIYATDGSGGTWPGNGSHNLIIQPRAEAATASRDIVLATCTTVQPVLSIIGNAQAAFGNGSGILHFTAAATNPNADPTSGMLLWHETGALKSRNGDLEIRTGNAGQVRLGARGPSSEAGVALGSSGIVTLYKKAADLILADVALGTKRTSAPADASLAAGELAMWFDQTAGAAKAMFKGKNASGTVVTGSVALT